MVSSVSKRQMWENIFFDFDHHCVNSQIQHCIDLAMWNGEEKTKPIEMPIPQNMSPICEAVSDYFKLATPTDCSLVFQQSAILADVLDDARRPSIAMMFADKFRHPSCHKLIYRGSRDGFKAEDFHRQCDGVQNTVCFIRDNNGNVLGGFTSVPWTSVSIAWKIDPEAFLFSIASPNITECRKHCCLVHTGYATAGAVYHNELFGPLYGVPGGNACFAIADNCTKSGSCTGIGGRGFDTSNSQIPMWQSSTVTKFCVVQIEVFALVECSASSVPQPPLVAPTPAPKTVSSIFKQPSSSQLETVAADLVKQESKLLRDARGVLAELHFVARYCGLTASVSAAAQKAAQTTVIQTVLAQIESMNTLLQYAKPPAVDIITISASGTLITTTKDTLRQAPEGSPLANMASDAWGHGLDRDGNIYQEVNPVLLTAIINHLRLKRMLGGTSIHVPPIVVYEEQKTALDNLLAFYMLTDLPVKVVKYNG